MGVPSKDPPASELDNNMSSETAPTTTKSPQPDEVQPPANQVVTIFLEGPMGSMVRVPDIQLRESVGALRVLVKEIPELSQFTSYSLKLVHVNPANLETTSGGKKKSKKKANRDDQEEPLDEYADLGTYEALRTGAFVRLSPMPYNVTTMHAHVKQARETLENPPCSLPFITTCKREDMYAEFRALAQQATKSQSDQAPKDAEDASKQDVEVAAKEANDRVPVDDAVPVPVQLDAFYPGNVQRASGLQVQTAYTSVLESMTAHPAPACVKSISFSGWNPPPRNRKMMGDLAYLDVETLEGTTLHVTATPSGFYVNGTETGGSFNPAPAAKPCFSDTIVGLLQAASPSFKKAYTALLAVAHQRAKTLSSNAVEVSHKSLFCDDIAKLHDIDSSESNNVSSKRAQWNVPLPRDVPATVPQSASVDADSQAWMSLSDTRATQQYNHEFNENRVEQFFKDTIGLDSYTSRDWNEDYQSIMELPAKQSEDRILRARALATLQGEFEEAATEGAIRVLEGRINPLNPAEAEASRVFVHNNIFYSFAALNDQTTDQNSASYCTSNHDLQGLKAFNAVLNAPVATTEEEEQQGDANVAPELLSHDGIHTLATAVVDYLGRRVIAQAIIPGILQSDAASSIFYGSVDQGQSIAQDERVHGLLRQVMEPLSIKASKVHPFGNSEGAEEETQPSSKLDHIKTKATDEVEIYGPVELKGIKGTDGRLYTLDVLRTTPIDVNYYTKDGKVTPLDVSNSGGYVALVRPELVTLYAHHLNGQVADERKAFVQQRLRAIVEEEKNKDGAAEKGEGEELVSKEQVQALSDEAMEKFPDPPLPAFDLNTFTTYNSAAQDEEKKSNEEQVIALGEYLVGNRIPSFIDEICTKSRRVLDGKSLCDALHAGGINLRYLGEICEQAINAELSSKLFLLGKHTKEDGSEIKSTKVIPPIARSFVELCEVEMISRACKWLLREFFNQHGDVAQAPAPTLALFLNYVFAGVDSKSKMTKKAADKTQLEASRMLGVSLTSGFLAGGTEGVWDRIHAHVEKHFKYKLRIWNPKPREGLSEEETKKEELHEFGSRATPIPLLRRLCQLCGFQVASRNYQLDNPKVFPFLPTDVLNVVPVVKSCMPEWPIQEAEDLLEVAKVQLRSAAKLSGNPAQQQFVKSAISRAYQWAEQAFELVNNTSNPQHIAAASCCAVMASIHSMAGDFPGAVMFQSRALSYMDRNGHRDGSDLAVAHMELSLYHQRVGNVDKAILHTRKAIYLFELMGGPSSFECWSMYQQLGNLYAFVGPTHLQLSVNCIREALRRCGHDRVGSGTCLHTLAQIVASAGKFRDAIQYEKAAMSVFEDTLGPDDARCAESMEWVKRFTTQAVQQGKMLVKLEQERAANNNAQELIAAAMASGAPPPVPAAAEPKTTQSQKKKSSGKKGGKKKH